MSHVTPGGARPSRPGRQDAWSIGIYTGRTPLSLAPPSPEGGPVLSAASVTDLQAEFVADPFLVREGGRWYIFFEIMPVNPHRGVIGMAESDDGLRWDYGGVILSEPFHLSYPHVIQYKYDYYMIPETLAPGQVRLYAASRFPDRWEHIADLLPGRHADPTIFLDGETWWMFTSNPEDSATLRLYSAVALSGPWAEHPLSPVVRDNRWGRPAGRVIAHEGSLMRFAQDCSTYYGKEVRAFRISTLSPTQYAEQPAASSPIVGPGSGDWNRWGMHHVDAHPRPGGGWIAARRRPLKLITRSYPFTTQAIWPWPHGRPSCQRRGDRSPVPLRHEARGQLRRHALPSPPARLDHREQSLQESAARLARRPQAQLPPDHPCLDAHSAAKELNDPILAHRNGRRASRPIRPPSSGPYSEASGDQCIPLAVLVRGLFWLFRSSTLTPALKRRDTATAPPPGHRDDLRRLHCCTFWETMYIMPPG